MKAIPTQTSLFHFDTILEKSNIQDGYIVADLGCGKSLSFLYSLTKLVGKDGKVYGIDILPEVIESLNSDISHHKLHSISSLKGDIEKNLDLKANSINTAFLINTLNQANDSLAMLKEAKRLLHPEGRLIIVDWNSSESPFGPLPSQRLSSEHVINTIDVAGLKLLDQFEPGLYHYGIVAGK